MSKELYIWEILSYYEDLVTVYIDGEDLDPKDVERVMKVLHFDGRLVGRVQPLDWRYQPPTSIWVEIRNVCYSDGNMENFAERVGPELWAKLAKRVGLK